MLHLSAYWQQGRALRLVPGCSAPCVCVGRARFKEITSRAFEQLAHQREWRCNISGITAATAVNRVNIVVVRFSKGGSVRGTG